MKINENKTKGITLFGVVAVMLVGGATVSLTLVSSVQAQNTPSLIQDQSSSQSNPSGEKERIITSNENSANSAAKNTFERDHDVKQASAASEPALDMERSIETPNKDIEIDVESNDKSAASASVLNEIDDSEIASSN